jgi:hypothetical protein
MVAKQAGECVHQHLDTYLAWLLLLCQYQLQFL